ncbi:MAG: tetratricopeptide repeat protein, partial [Anaerolineae bacterium]|nr:tetratricopeptide repeat protein [Anaerolineae bacterium]
DQLSFQKTISQSLALDTEFDTTWMIIGDVEANINQDSAAAIEAYRKALELVPGNCTVQHVVGSLQIQQSQWAGAITDLEGALEYCAASSNAWDMYRMLAVAYFYQGEQAEALEMANQALLLVPEDQRSVIEQLIAAIQQQAPTELVPGASPVPTPEPAPDSSVPVTP